MEDTQSHENQDDVGEPRIQGSEVKPMQDTVGVQQLEDVEVEQVEAVAALTNQEEGTPGEESRDRMGSTQTQDKGGEQGGHEAAMNQKIGGTAYEGIEEEPDEDEADGGEDEALTRGQDQRVLQFAQGNAGEKGASVGQGGVLKKADELGGAVPVYGADDVVGIQVEVERVRHEADDPEGEEEKYQLPGLFGPG